MAGEACTGTFEFSSTFRMSSIFLLLRRMYLRDFFRSRKLIFLLAGAAVDGLCSFRNVSAFLL